MSDKKLKTVSFAALLCTVLVLLAYCAAFSIEAEYSYAENKLLRERVQELEARPLTIELVREEPDGAAWKSIGECTITHYCGCSECCGKSDCITATGTFAKMGRTVAVDPDVIPLGSEVIINGQIFIAEDTGITGNHIDIYIESHEQAKQMGVYKTNVSFR